MSELAAYEGKPLLKILGEIERRAGCIVSDRINLRVTPQRKEVLLAKFGGGLDNFAGKRVTETITKDGFKFMLGDGCWVMFRASGTEPVFRCYLEARTEEELAKLRQAALKLVM
jgi:phosphomannomutase